MNITLDLPKGQLSKLRNGHGIRISPTMLGSGVEMIIDPMTYHNISKKMNKGGFKTGILYEWKKMMIKHAPSIYTLQSIILLLPVSLSSRP
jgi:predicted DNA-binding protein (UPF0278 family)